MIIDYASLKSAIAQELNRDDLINDIPLFIQTMERQTERQLRVREMLNQYPFVLDSLTEALPDDFLEVRTINVDDATPFNMSFISLDYFTQSAQSGKPMQFTVLGNNLKFSKTPDKPYNATLVYYQNIPQLSDTVATNWLLNKHPDIYFYGALLNSAPFLKEDARINTWIQFYQNAVDSLKILDERGRTASNGLKQIVKGFA